MKTILVSTSNPGKIKEIKAILSDFEILPLKEAEARLGKTFVVTEEQDTFEGNALEKAECLFAQSNGEFYCLADDSGIEIDCLDGFPGVKTARWMPADDHTKNLELIKKVDAATSAKPEASTSTSAEADAANAKTAPSRACHYSTCMALIMPNGEKKTFTATIDGQITRAPRGENGFGFDEIFELPSGKTLAEISMEEKNEFSPRRLALDQIKAYFA